MTPSFVDPSTLSLPSPQSDIPDSPHPSHSDSVAGPSRKRPRTEISADERKEARAHRNRIAAQNSRDKRKAQFTALERRVAELEEENKQLRAGMTLSDLQHADVRRAQEQEREKARERENTELRERIKSLENGWEAVMKVLAAQGLPTPAPTTESTPPIPESSPPSNNTTTTFPVLVPSAPVFPITPSPSISGTIHLPPSTGGDRRGNSHRGVPAAGGLNPTLLSAFPSPTTSLPDADFAPTPLAFDAASSHAPADEAAVDAWIREIFSGSPLGASAPLLECDSLGEEPVVPYTAATPSTAPLIGSMTIGPDWGDEMEMQRLLEMVQSDGDDNQAMDANTALGLELCGGWSFDRDPAPALFGVGAF